MARADLRARVQAQLAGAGLAPLHRLGQNFMVDSAALDLLVSELDAGVGVRVAEIGPGTGFLTERLLAVGATVLAVEIDQGMAGLLEERFGVIRQTEGAPSQIENHRPEAPFTLIHGDCLASKSRLHPALEAFASQPWKLGANLPYDVALPAILNAAALPLPPERIVVTVQYEAAQRLCSRPGADAWGASAAVLQAAGTPRLVRKLAPSSFFPAPRVDSAVLSWTPTRVLPSGFGAWCRAVFAYRRKVLPGALRDAGLTRALAEDACRACGLDASRRVEALDAVELLALHRVVVELSVTAAPPGDDA